MADDRQLQFSRRRNSEPLSAPDGDRRSGDRSGQRSGRRGLTDVLDIAYCLITVPSSRRISPQPPFRLLAPLVNGAFAAAFSSTSMPQPGFSLTQRYPSFITGQPAKISCVRALNGEYSCMPKL